MHLPHLFLLLLLLLSAPLPSPGHDLPRVSPRRCVRPRPLTRSFCKDPPVVPNIDLPAYSGRWFQLFTSGVSTRLSEPACVTANYTLLPEGRGYEVKNCNYNPTLARPDCGRGFATRKPGGRTSQLQVQFFPFIPPGDYNVAALIGRANVGYVAAAVYNCNVTEAGLEDGFFVIARTPFRPGLVKRILADKLRCMGYVLDEPFLPSGNGPECKYFFGPDGFDLRYALSGIP